MTTESQPIGALEWLRRERAGEIECVDRALKCHGLPTYSAMRAQRDELLAVAIAYQEVRRLQTAYFKSRRGDDLIISKQAEKALDAQARAAIAKARS